MLLYVTSFSGYFSNSLINEPGLSLSRLTKTKISDNLRLKSLWVIKSLKNGGTKSLLKNTVLKDQVIENIIFSNTDMELINFEFTNLNNAIIEKIIDRHKLREQIRKSNITIA